MFDWAGNLRKIQVEVTSHCNARCGACMRNIMGGDIQPWLKLEHLDMSIWERLVYSDTAGIKIGRLTLNGNVGDPGMNPNLPEMMRMYIDAHPETTIFIATNGSMQNTDWWYELATVLFQSANHRVQFALDGLSDTHHIYRRRTDWHKICENIRAFAEYGRAGVITTLFDHNTHQIDELQRLCEDDLGCVHFVTRRSHTDLMEIQDGEENYTITTDLVDDSMIRNVFLKNDERPLSLSEKANQMRIPQSELNRLLDTKCPWYNEGEIQILADGRVFPCCHISHNWVYPETDNEFNLKETTLLDILKDSWYTHTIPDAVSQGRWLDCRRSCGVCDT